MKKRVVRGILKGALLIVMLLIVLSRAGALVERKASMEKYQPFYEQKEPFDVLIIGTSHAINGIFPMDLWNEYGIVSYNFGGHDNQPATSYWVLQNALQYTTPEMVVLDVFGVASQGKVSDDLSYLHLSTDSMPLSSTKVMMMDDILPEYADKSEFLFNFSIYHNRWSELKRNDFQPSITKEKGAESRIRVGRANEFQLIGKHQRFEEESLGKEYIEKIITTCQEKGIEILLVNVPFPASEEKQRNANSIYPIAEKYGVKYINYLYQEGIVDFETDVYDADAHLNPSGARKVTKDLGKILSEEYQMPDHRGDEAYQEWHQDYREYQEFKWENLKKQDLNEYLMLLHDGELDCYFRFADRFDWTHSELIVSLLDNLSVKDHKLQILQGEQYIAIRRQEKEEFIYGRDTYPSEISTLLSDLGKAVLKAVIVENSTGDIIDCAAFDEDGSRIE